MSKQVDELVVTEITRVENPEVAEVQSTFTYVNELVIADVDYPDESQLTASIHEDYVYVLLEDDKKLPRNGNLANKEFFINRDTAIRMRDRLAYLDEYGDVAIKDTFRCLEDNMFTITLLDTMNQVLLVDDKSYVGVSASYDDARRFREFLEKFIVEWENE